MNTDKCMEYTTYSSKREVQGSRLLTYGVSTYDSEARAPRVAWVGTVRLQLARNKCAELFSRYISRRVRYGGSG